MNDNVEQTLLRDGYIKIYKALSQIIVEGISYRSDDISAQQVRRRLSNIMDHSAYDAIQFNSNSGLPNIQFIEFHSVIKRLASADYTTDDIIAILMGDPVHVIECGYAIMDSEFATMWVSDINEHMIRCMNFLRMHFNGSDARSENQDSIHHSFGRLSRDLKDMGHSDMMIQLTDESYPAIDRAVASSILLDLTKRIRLAGPLHGSQEFAVVRELKSLVPQVTQILLETPESTPLSMRMTYFKELASDYL